MLNKTSISLSHKTSKFQRWKFFYTSLKITFRACMLTVKLLASAHGHITTGDPCLPLSILMLNITSISLSHKPPKFQRWKFFYTSLKSTPWGWLLIVMLLAVRILWCPNAHGHIFTGDPCLQLSILKVNTTSISLSYKTPKSQRWKKCYTSLKSTPWACSLNVKLLLLKLFKCPWSLNTTSLSLSY